ncbi:VCBS repeat-containing protein [Actinoplanes sp. NPDC026623]|uniref:VCBS repeat-containing protein n=1 Tax=Actinoplanes sp. NPDC026623 TaxID=3155610 RepID=UPI0033F098AD
MTARPIFTPAPAFSDADGWAQPQYCSTIRCADVDGDGKAEVLARGVSGVQVWDLDQGDLWAGWPSLADLTDAANWNQAQYYSTISYADIDGDGRAELLARGAAGIRAYEFDPATRTWSRLPDGPPLSDASGWGDKRYYSTIQCADIDGDGRAELIARGAAGIQAYKFDPATRSWNLLPAGPPLSDASGWGMQQYYSTIQCADIDGDGRAELVARGGAGLIAYKFTGVAWQSMADIRLKREDAAYSFLMSRGPSAGQAIIYRDDWFGVRAARLLSGDVADVALIMPDPTGLRVGPGTGVTIYQQSDFQGPSQQVLADVPAIHDTRPGSLSALKIWADVDRPFGGRWAIRTPNGYLRVTRGRPGTTSWVTTLGTTANADALFRLLPRGATPDGQLVQLTTADGAVAFARPTAAERHLLKGGTSTPFEEGTMTLVEEPDRYGRTFSLKDANAQWVALDGSGQFARSGDRDQRLIFTRDVRFADDETQVGTLAPGEVVLYENPAYWGRAWISGAELSDFLRIDGLNDVVSSLRLGPETGVTLYRDVAFGDVREDAVTAIPRMSGTQVGDDALSSLHVWHNIAPSAVGITCSVRLSQDYEPVADGFRPFSAYRTLIQLPYDVTEVEVWATDQVTIVVNGQTYQIDEDTSKKLTPNSLAQLTVLTRASGLSTPGLKLRTDRMAGFERCVVFPDRQIHEHLAQLPAGALYDANTRDGGSLVNKATVTRQQADNVQSTITLAMSTLRYDTPDRPTPQVDAAGLQGRSWKLDFGDPLVRPVDGTNPASFIINPDAPDRPGAPVDPAGLVFAGPSLRPVTADEIDRLLSQANTGVTLAQGVLDDLWSGIKQAASIVVTAVHDVVLVVVRYVRQGIQLIENAAEKVVAWVIDSAETVATFVRGVVEKIGVALHDFVQWLEFAFDWQDILATHRYLHDSVIQGLDYLQQLVVTSEKPVTDFFDRQAENLVEHINLAIGQLGGEPAELAGETHPPAELEWFLARLGDNAQDTGGKPVPRSDLAGRWDAVRHSYQGLADGLVTRLDKLVDVVTLLPENPQHAVAGFLVIVRELVEPAVGATRATVLLLLELAATVIEELKRLLDHEIDIPFISDFYSKVIVGDPNEKLTLLNLTTLLVAIPATVLGKIVLGRRPFANAQPLALSASAEAARDWAIVTSVAGYVGGVMSAPMDAIPETNTPSFLWMFEGAGLVLSYISWLGSFPGGSPDQLSFDAIDEDKIWDLTLWSYATLLLGVDTASFVCTNLESFKRANDVSAGAKSVLSAVALVLSISANARKRESVVKGFGDAIGTLPGIAAFSRMTVVSTASAGISLGVLAGIDNLSAQACLVLANVEQ